MKCDGVFTATGSDHDDLHGFALSVQEFCGGDCKVRSLNPKPKIAHRNQRMIHRGRPTIESVSAVPDCTWCGESVNRCSQAQDQRKLKSIHVIRDRNRKVVRWGERGGVFLTWSRKENSNP